MSYLYILGAGTPTPTSERFGSSYVIELDNNNSKIMFDRIKKKYDDQTTPYYAASRLWVDAIIDPLDTRKAISMGIEAADHAPITKKFNLGLIQT